MKKKKPAVRFCRGTEQGCHASLPVTGWGPQAERPPWGHQEGPWGALALVQGQSRAENRFSRVSVKGFRVCPVESHWRILGRRVTCSGWVLEARSSASIAAKVLGWVDLSMETSLEAVGIRQVGDGESGRAVAAGREGWYVRMTSGDEPQRGQQCGGGGLGSYLNTGCEHPKTREPWIVPLSWRMNSELMDCSLPGSCVHGIL